MTWTEAEANFAEKFVGYEPRLPQRALANTIEGALSAGVHLAAQAPCGTGKSYAGQVPAIDYALATGLPVILSTATKALQDQYIRDAEALQELYRPFRFATLKGRSNYLCLDKLDGIDGDLEGDEAALRAELKDVEATGDFDLLTTPITPFDKSKLSTSSEECPGKKECVFGDVCFAEKAKRRAADAQVVVVNHALLVTDAQLKYIATDTGAEGLGTAILPNYSAVVVDEGHELEEYATSTLGKEISQKSLERLANEVSNFLETDVLTSARNTIARLYNALGAQFPSDRPRERSITLSAKLLVNVGEEINDVIEVLRDFEEQLRTKQIFGNDRASMTKKRLRKRVEGLTRRLENIIVADFADLVRWAEKVTVRPARRDPYTHIVLKSAPLSVAPFLKATLWDQVPAVLMSATLSTAVDKNGQADFSFLAERLGIEDLVGFDCESPFDFEHQARIYVADTPEPNQPGYRAAVTANLIELVRAADGRGLLLFTSWDGLNEAYNALSPVINGMGHRCLKQGELPNKQLSQIFAEDEHSVLFAVKSFFTGIDIAGDSLRLLVIDKLPFANPSDVIFKARCDALDATARNKWTDGSFPKLSIPTMVLTLLQGLGRLIRTKDDKGLIAILDPRLNTKPYGKKILKTFPPAPVLTDLRQAIDYLEGLEA
jgi:ATP-dependent DNA helicase DinG